MEIVIAPDYCERPNLTPALRAGIVAVGEAAGFTSVIIHAPHGHPERNLREESPETLQIVLWAPPPGASAVAVHPERNLPAGFCDDGIFAAPPGAIIWREVLLCSAPLACRVGNTIFLLADLWHYRTQPEEELILQILGNLLRAISPEEKARREKATARTALQQWARAEHDTALQEARGALSRALVGAADYREAARREDLRARNLQREVIALSRPQHVTSLPLLLRACQEAGFNPPVIAAESITLTTAVPIIIGAHEIGVMQITLPASGEISVKNLTRKVHGLEEGMHHPHIFPARPCWGNVGSQVTALLEGRDLANLIPLLGDYLRTVSTGDDAGRYVHRWPLAEGKTCPACGGEGEEWDMPIACGICGGNPDSCDCCHQCENPGDECTCCGDCGRTEENCRCNICPDCGNHHDDCACGEEEEA